MVRHKTTIKNIIFILIFAAVAALLTAYIDEGLKVYTVNMAQASGSILA